MAGKKSSGGSKTRNPDRKGAMGKAFAKNHNNPPKNLTEATILRRAEHKLKVAHRVRREPGSPVTMPDIDWDWFENTMASRWPNTRRLRVIDSYIDQARIVRKAPVTDEGVSVIHSNSEAKTSSARPSRQSLRRAKAAERKNGR